MKCIKGARWYILIPKIPVWLHFGDPWNGKCWCTLWPFGIFTTTWHTLWSFVIFYSNLVFFPVLVYFTDKNLATISSTTYYICMYLMTQHFAFLNAELFSSTVPKIDIHLNSSSWFCFHRWEKWSDRRVLEINKIYSRKKTKKCLNQAKPLTGG
jgi:hypothetical protein